MTFITMADAAFEAVERRAREDWEGSGDAVTGGREPLAGDVSSRGTETLPATRHPVGDAVSATAEVLTAYLPAEVLALYIPASSLAVSLGDGPELGIMLGMWALAPVIAWATFAACILSRVRAAESGASGLVRVDLPPWLRSLLRVQTPDEAAAGRPYVLPWPRWRLLAAALSFGPYAFSIHGSSVRAIWPNASVNAIAVTSAIVALTMTTALRLLAPWFDAQDGTASPST